MLEKIKWLTKIVLIGVAVFYAILFVTAWI